MWAAVKFSPSINTANLRMLVGGAATGALVTPCLMYVAFVYSIHGGFDLPALLFPYAVIASPTMERVNALSLLLASIQFPFYGVTVGAAKAVGRRWVYVCGLTVTVVHCAGVVVAFQRVLSVPLIKFP